MADRKRSSSGHGGYSDSYGSELKRPRSKCYCIGFFFISALLYYKHVLTSHP